MKKALSLILALVMCLYLCACDNSNTDTSNPTNGDSTNPSTNTNTTTENITDTPSTNNTENNQAEAPNHPLVQDICGEWVPDEDTVDQAPFQSLIINKDGSCVVDGTPATWKIENSYTTDTDLSIRVYMDGKISFGMVVYLPMDHALLTEALDETFDNSPMYFVQCTIVKK